MSRKRAVIAGVLCANSLPHLACAAAGRRMLTPLGGQDSSPALNALWGAANLAGGLVLIGRTVRGRAGDQADRGDAAGRAVRDDAAGRSSLNSLAELNAFAAGAALFALWGVVGEKVFRFNG